MDVLIRIGVLTVRDMAPSGHGLLRFLVRGSQNNSWVLGPHVTKVYVITAQQQSSLSL